MTTKEQTLAILLDRPEEYISGEVLADMEGVSRNSIWKAVKSLRAEGYNIEAVTNRGYRLLGDHEPVSEEGIRRYLKTKLIGQTIEARSVMASTNARAKELAGQGAPEGTIVVARGQTNGKGRAERKFHSPADSGVYVSFILRPKAGSDRAVRLTMLSAVATARAIERVSNVRAGIKWVNDIFIDGKKAAGILCETEQRADSAFVSYAIVGIGINVSKQIFPPELQSIATSIGNASGNDISKNRLIAELCGAMESLLAEDDPIQEYRERSIVPGKCVKVITEDGSYSATAVAINDDGELIVDTGFGTRTLRAGEVSIIGE